MSERDCQHGQHARACPLCASEQQVAALTAQLAEAQQSREAYRKMALLREAEATALREALAKAEAERDEALSKLDTARRQESDNMTIAMLHADNVTLRQKLAAIRGGQP